MQHEQPSHRDTKFPRARTSTQQAVRCQPWVLNTVWQQHLHLPLHLQWWGRVVGTGWCTRVKYTIWICCLSKGTNGCPEINYKIICWNCTLICKGIATQPYLYDNNVKQSSLRRPSGAPCKQTCCVLFVCLTKEQPSSAYVKLFLLQFKPGVLCFIHISRKNGLFL